MADQNLGVLYTPIEARLQPLEQGIKRAEGMVREGAKKMEKDAKVNFSASTGNGIGRGLGGLGGIGGIGGGGASGAMLGGGFLEQGVRFAAGIQAASVAFSAVNVASKIFRGDMEAARESLFQMPLGIGQLAKALDSLLDNGGLQQIDDTIKRNNDEHRRTNELIRERAQLLKRTSDRITDTAFEAAEFGLEGFDKERADVNTERFKRLQEIEKEEMEAKKLRLDISSDLAFEREKVEELTRKKIEAINKKENEQKEKAAKEQAEKDQKIAEDALRTKQRQEDQALDLRDRNDVMLLEQTDATAARRLQIERDAEAAIRKATIDGNTQLIPEIERQKALRLAGIIPQRAQQIDDISRMVLGGGAGMQRVGQDEPPASKKQADTQIGVLRDMLSAITRLKLEATAN